MGVRKKSTTDAKLILGGMITDTIVLSRIASQWRPEGLFPSEEANLLARWCLKFLDKYGQAPGKRMNAMFHTWADQKGVPEDRANLVGRVLEGVNDTMLVNEGVSSDYIIDRAKEFFTSTMLRREWEEAEMDLDRGKVEQAYTRMIGLNKVEMGQGSTIKLAEDFETWREVLNVARQEPIVYYPGIVGRFFGETLGRDCFVGFMGPDKSFKSFWIMDVGFRGLVAKKRVAMFEVGDMSRDQIMSRMAERFSRRPIRPKKFTVPKELYMTEEGGVDVKWEEKEAKERLTVKEVYNRVRKLCWQRDMFRLSCHPNDTLSVYGIRTIIDEWEREGWVPDIVLIDYADILAPPRGILDEKEQTDKTWKELRRMSQELHALVVTGTQSNAAAYTNKQRTLGRKHFSGRKTKLAHVTGMVGLNVSDEFKKKCMTGLNWVVRRDGKYSERWMCITAGCLDIGNPCIKSFENVKKNQARSD